MNEKTHTLAALLAAVLIGLIGQVGPEVQAGQHGETRYKGTPISLNLKDADVATVLHTIAKEMGLNLVLAQDVGGKISLHLVDVPWDQALAEILKTSGLGMRRVGNVIHVYTLDGLKRELAFKELVRGDAERELEAKRKARETAKTLRLEQEMAKPLVSRVFYIRYAKAEELKENLAPHLSRDAKGQPRGSIAVNQFTNSLLVRDVAEVVEEIGRLLADLDKPTPQILIEARIVQVDTSLAREFGIQWGGQYAERGSGGDRWAYGVSSGPGGTSPSSWSSGSFSGGTGADFFPLSSWAVNLPATLLTPAPAIGFQVGRLVGDIINLDLRLSAAEKEQRLKILSRPRIVAMDNTEAVIKRGQEIPYIVPKETGATVEVDYKEALLELRVRPHVIGDNRVAIDVTLKNDQKTDDFVTAATSQFPIISRQEASTRALVSNGETIVLGGIIQETRSDNEAGVPHLRDVPLLSWLFQREGKSTETRELLIFVTPWILNGGER